MTAKHTQAIEQAQTESLLSLLPGEAFARLAHLGLQRLELKPRRVLHFERCPMEHVYFIERGWVSVMASAGPHAWQEAWLVGPIGVACAPAILGAKISNYRRIICVEGAAVRIRAVELRRAMTECPALRDLLLGALSVILHHTAQTSVCNASHEVEKRLARWLLTVCEEGDCESLHITHDMLARVMGIRRATVSETLARLQADGIVGASRGRLTLLDRAALEERACHCHRLMRQEQDRFLVDYRSRHPRESVGDAVGRGVVPARAPEQGPHGRDHSASGSASSPGFVATP